MSLFTIYSEIRKVKKELDAYQSQVSKTINRLEEMILSRIINSNQGNQNMFEEVLCEGDQSEIQDLVLNLGGHIQNERHFSKMIKKEIDSEVKHPYAENTCFNNNIPLIINKEKSSISKFSNCESKSPLTNKCNYQNNPRSKATRNGLQLENLSERSVNLNQLENSNKPTFLNNENNNSYNYSLLAARSSNVISNPSNIKLFNVNSNQWDVNYQQIKNNTDNENQIYNNYSSNINVGMFTDTDHTSSGYNNGENSFNSNCYQYPANHSLNVLNPSYHAYNNFLSNDVCVGNEAKFNYHN